MTTPIIPPLPTSSSRLPTLATALTLTLTLAVLLLATGCVFPRTHAHRSSSVVAFLYPKETTPLPDTAIPTLRLPLRVGIAFVPSQGAATVSELQKSALLQRVAAEFRGRDYIESIEVVPSTYLRPGGGFENLEQVRRLLHFDLVALVAYDQVQFTDPNLLSLAYWTIVGAYLFHGNENDTQTLMEASVYDISSRHLLFRAPGASQVRATSAAVYADEHLRTDSVKSFDAATDDLIANLKTQLEDFRARLKSAPDTIAKIERKPGYTGAGSLDAWLALPLLTLTALALLRRRRT